MNSGRMRSSCVSRKPRQFASSVGQRIAISGRPAFDHVEDVNIFALQPAGFDDFREQLPAAADERFAQPIFVRAGRFAQKAQSCRRIADAEHRLRPRAGQFAAARAAGDFLLQDIERTVLALSAFLASHRRSNNERRRCFRLSWLRSARLRSVSNGGCVGRRPDSLSQRHRRCDFARGSCSTPACCKLSSRSATMRRKSFDHCLIAWQAPTTEAKRRPKRLGNSGPGSRDVLCCQCRQVVRSKGATARRFCRRQPIAGQSPGDFALRSATTPRRRVNYDGFKELSGQFHALLRRTAVVLGCAEASISALKP